MPLIVTLVIRASAPCTSPTTRLAPVSKTRRARKICSTFFNVCSSELDFYVVVLVQHVAGLRRCDDAVGVRLQQQTISNEVFGRCRRRVDISLVIAISLLQRQ